MLPAGAPPSAPGIGPLRRHGATVFSESAAEIQPEASPDDGSTNRPLGWLVVRRPATAAPTADILNRLVGGAATIAVGNNDGSTWTDLAQPIDVPRVDLSRIGPADEQTKSGGRYIGALSAIRGTPWNVWIAFPETAVLEPAHAFLRRMLLIAIMFLVFATGIVALVSLRITSPPHTLTSASEAIASREDSRRVPGDP